MAAALTCLALDIYQEARGEPLNGQYAVALVAWNRANHKVGNVCKVITKPYQFSWTIHKLKYRHGQYVVRKQGLPKRGEAWNSALFTARLVLRNKMPDLTHGATFYHADYVRPAWRRTMRRTVVEGHHIFYRQYISQN